MTVKTFATSPLSPTPTRRRRVLHVLTSLGPGGAETNLLALMEHFDHVNFEHVVAYGGSGALENEFRARGISLLSLSPRVISSRSVLELPRILRRIAKLQPDIIHSHLDLANLLSLLARVLLRTALVFHFHGLTIVPRKVLPGRTGKHRFWHALTPLYRYADAAIAICAFQLPFLAKAGFPAARVALIPNGITVRPQPPRPTNRASGEYRFVCVARFFPGKDHQFLVRAFRDVCAHGHQCRLLLVGDGPMRPAIEAEVERLGISDRVEFLGMRRDVPNILASSDCFVLCSSWELQPVSILEAMLAGLPVVATRVGGIPDTVTHNYSGILVEPRNREQLADAMLQMASNPSWGVKMGADGHRLVANKFSNAHVARKIEEAVYIPLLSEPR